MKGRIGITRCGMGDDTRMRIELEDAKSGVSFLEVTVGMEDWAYASTGLFGREVEFTLRGADLIGMKHETMSALVPITPELDSYTARDDQKAIRAALAPFEIGGWKGRVTDLFNHHCRERDDDGNIFQKVNFHRYVEDIEDA